MDRGNRNMREDFMPSSQQLLKFVPILILSALRVNIGKMACWLVL
jgi:hypothetical protein